MLRLNLHISTSSWHHVVGTISHLLQLLLHHQQWLFCLPRQIFWAAQLTSVAFEFRVLISFMLNGNFLNLWSLESLSVGNSYVVCCFWAMIFFFPYHKWLVRVICNVLNLRYVSSLDTHLYLCICWTDFMVLWSGVYWLLL